MNIIYSQRTRLDPKVEAQFDAKFVSLKELIQTSDVLSLHCPLNDATHHMIGAPEFKQMKSSAYLINAARGPVIDEAALLEALKAGELAGAALDVYEAEPNVDDGFKALDNVILTPHVGNATVEARDAMAAIVAKNTVRIDQGQEPLHIVN